MFLKLLALAAILVAVWYVFRLGMAAQSKRDRVARRKGAVPRASDAARPAPPADEAEEMRPCPACGTYVPASGAARCGRADCPQRG
ncbi:MAG TPA: hypothetical protein VEB20_01150 [Azospirillaceae bacterium]|nr:hypothetical protein [Azospirillaceae bacterium]